MDDMIDLLYNGFVEAQSEIVCRHKGCHRFAREVHQYTSQGKLTPEGIDYVTRSLDQSQPLSNHYLAFTSLVEQKILEKLGVKRWKN